MDGDNQRLLSFAGWLDIDWEPRKQPYNQDLDPILTAESTLMKLTAKVMRQISWSANLIPGEIMTAQKRNLLELSALMRTESVERMSGGVAVENAKVFQYYVTQWKTVKMEVTRKEISVIPNWV